MSLGLMLVCAMCLDAALGEPDWLWSRVKHPAVMIGNLIAWLDNRLYVLILALFHHLCPSLDTKHGAHDD